MQRHRFIERRLWTSLTEQEPEEQKTALIKGPAHQHSGLSRRVVSHKTFWRVTAERGQVQMMKLMRSEFHLAALVSGSWRCACWLSLRLPWPTGTLKWNRAILNAVRKICRFWQAKMPAGEKGLELRDVTELITMIGVRVFCPDGAVHQTQRAHTHMVV